MILDKDKYQIVLADPPWDWKTYSERGRGKSPKYPVMDFDQLCGLPVSQIVANNSALFLWVTWPMLQYGLDLISAWGFTYRTLAFDWFKLTTTGSKPAFGNGYYFRAGPEPCLLGVRGSMPVAVKNERNIIVAAGRQHSRKPDETYEKIEAVYPQSIYPRRLELFASQYSIPLASQYGYEAMGYDVDGMNIHVSLDAKIVSISSHA